jgi:hypothetical protein
LVRNLKKFPENAADTINQAEINQPDTLKVICHIINVLISSVGITRQREWLTCMNVDYQANANLLKEIMILNF